MHHPRDNFLSLFFADGSTDAAQAADTLAKVRTFMESGNYYARLDDQNGGAAGNGARRTDASRGRFELYFRYTSVAAPGRTPAAAAAVGGRAAAAVAHLLRPDALLDAVRLAVLSQVSPAAARRR